MEKEKKVRQKINWKKEMKLAPGYIVIILWVIFTFMLLGWILAASLSTTTDIFAGKALKFPTGLHFENYMQAWGSGGVATFFMNSMLYSFSGSVTEPQARNTPRRNDIRQHLRTVISRGTPRRCPLSIPHPSSPKEASLPLISMRYALLPPSRERLSVTSWGCTSKTSRRSRNARRATALFSVSMERRLSPPPR